MRPLADETELDRLDLQHATFLLTLNGSLHKAPIPSDIQHVLDVGTGTGIWAIDMAGAHPSATVTGTDLSPVQPACVPTNCRFYVENAEEPWNFDHPFDFIHSRMLVIALRDWRNYFRQAFENLKPGGYVECQDLNFPVRCDDDTAPPESPMMQWSDMMIQAAGNLGVDLTISMHFPQLLHEAGFIDIQVETYVWPHNQWPREREMKRLGLYCGENFAQGVHGFSMGLFTRGLGMEPQAVEEFVVKVKAQSLEVGSHVYLPVSFFWARKPFDVK